MSAVSPGELIDGRYRVISRVGAGGMADVFLAEDQQLRRNVALKLLHRRFAEDPGFVERFRREAQAAASLQHPNVVSVFDRGGFDGTYYIAMEYLQGRSLKALIRREAPLDPIRAIDITAQILKAARFAHRRGVIHRDLKPHNVIVDENDHAKVTDFGIARAGASDMTETGSIMGTAQYLSPEQAQGHAVSESSDLYSIGVILYELVTGRVPFDAESAVTIALKHVSEAPIPPSQINPAVPPALEQVVLWALNKNAADRPADAEQFLSVLEQVRESLVAGGGGGQITASMAAVGAGIGSRPLYGPDRAAVVPTAVLPPSTALIAYEASRGPALAEEDATGARARVNGDGGEQRRGGGPWPWIVGLLILLLAAGGVAAYLLTRPAKATVPVVVNLPLQSAQSSVESHGFAALASYETSTAPYGTVINQFPLGGTRADKGTTVTLTVSNGPGDVNIPSVAGLSESEAVRALKRSGLNVAHFEPQSSDVVPANEAIATSPAAGQSVQKGYGVTLYVSTGRGSVNVPDVGGDTLGAARAQLEAFGFKVTSTTQMSSTVAPGNVISQSPASGTPAQYASTVQIVVATAPTTVQVPSVVGFTAAAANQALSTANLKVISTTKDVSAQNQDGNVISQSPVSGATAKKGSTVTIVVGRYVASNTTTTTTTTTPNLNPTTTPTTPASTTTTPATTTPNTSGTTTPTDTGTTSTPTTTTTTTSSTTTTG